MNPLSFRVVKAALLLTAAALLIFPATSLAKCPGVHHGASMFGWNKLFGSDAWPYYEHNRGKVRFNGIADNDQVIVNGCQAGKPGEVSDLFLDPGTYNITVQRNGHEVLSRKLSVQNGTVTDLNISQTR